LKIILKLNWGQPLETGALKWSTGIRQYPFSRDFKWAKLQKIKRERRLQKSNHKVYPTIVPGTFIGGSWF
jgi:hypothetical protein